MTPPRHHAGFAAAMEDVLKVYRRPPDPARPLVCFDEARKERHGHVRPPLPAVPGSPARQDHEDTRAGSAHVFLACAPHLGWREARVTARRRAVDVAHALRDLVDAQFPEAARIVVVTDQRTVPTPASLDETFPPAEARRIATRLAWHHTPTHGRWLNMAESERSVLTQQCLDRRIADAATLATEVAAWVAARNAVATPIIWRFTLEVARIRLARVYPEVDT